MKPLDNITAVLVVHNEEHFIERCLVSINKVTKNILVIHDGKCKDNTLEICKKFGCKIFTRQYVGNAEPHRAWSYNYINTEWILQIDADEYLSSSLINNISNLININSVNCWEILWPYYDGKRYCTKGWPYKKALFRKSKIQFIASPHEEVRVDGMVKRCQYRLEHKPNYDNYTFKQLFTKHIKWINIHAHYLLQNQDEFDRFPKGNNLKPHYCIIAKHPLLLSVPIFLYHFTGSVYLGGAKEGWYGFRNSFVQSLYYFLLCIKIAQLKLKGII